MSELRIESASQQGSSPAGEKATPATRQTAGTRDKPRKAGGSPTSTSAWQAYRRTQVALFPGRFRWLAGLGVLFISAFHALDIYYPWPEYVDLTQREFIGIRALWVSLYLAMLATSYFREADERLQLIRDYGLTCVTAGFLGVLCAHTGRIGSPYYGGLLLLMLARVVLLPGVFSRSAKVCLAMSATWTLVSSCWPARLPPPALSGHHGELALANGMFLLGGLLLILIGAKLADRLAMGLEVAKLMGRYRLGRKLGVGGMGEVYLAYHASLRRPCAVKILKEEFCGPHANARFEREAEAASRLRHPNTIAVFDFGRTETGQPYYVMEYLEGCDLRQLVTKDGLLSPARAVHLLHQAAGSLAEAHARGMVHRDIKPGNLFVTSVGGRSDFIKVLDFGLVKGADLGPDLTRTNAFMGTPRYMAPEALMGKEVDARADVYALGAVGYFLLCGQPPFFSDDPYEDIQRQLSEAPPPIEQRRDAGLPRPSRALEEVLRRCLCKDPEGRYRNAGELEAALEGLPEFGQWTPESNQSTIERKSARAVLRRAEAPSRDELADTVAAMDSGDLSG